MSDNSKIHERETAFHDEWARSSDLSSIKVRAEWKMEKDRKAESGDRIVVNSVPYGVETGPLLTSIGDIINGRKLPQLVGVADDRYHQALWRIDGDTKIHVLLDEHLFVGIVQRRIEARMLFQRVGDGLDHPGKDTGGSARWRAMHALHEGTDIDLVHVRRECRLRHRRWHPGHSG